MLILRFLSHADFISTSQYIGMLHISKILKQVQDDLLGFNIVAIRIQKE
jgi:hypothetical protein